MAGVDVAGGHRGDGKLVTQVAPEITQGGPDVEDPKALPGGELANTLSCGRASPSDIAAIADIDRHPDQLASALILAFEDAGVDVSDDLWPAAAATDEEGFLAEFEDDADEAVRHTLAFRSDTDRTPTHF